MQNFVADFETTTIPEDCRVWAYAYTEVGNNSEDVKIGTSLTEFMKVWEDRKTNDKVFFHNLKFDGQFIIQWLFENGFKYVEDKKDSASRTFTTLISDKGLWYSIEVYFFKKNKKINKVIFQDSMKLIPLSVDGIAKTFHLPMEKLKLDYKSHDYLPEGTPLTPEEEEYIKHDVQIVAYALNYFFEQGLDKMTIGSCALDDYKKLIGKRTFERYYPTPKYHEDVKQSYKGGFTYLNPEFAGKVVGNGVVLDVNSLYPSVMYYDYLPFGTPIFFEGKYEQDNIYPLYIQMFSCSFELKKGKIPTIQIKNNPFHFSGNEYLTSSDDMEIVLCLNSVDFELFLEHYDVYNLEFISGWKFKATKGLFTDYIDKWSNNKIQAKKDKNYGLYYISKLFLNSLYGKFGTSNIARSKIPVFDGEKVIFKIGDDEEKDGIYIAMASFITSYARLKTISSAQTIMDNYNSGKSNIQFIYADTDSLHCVSPDFELPELEIDDTKLGAWKYESKFNKAKFLRQKCYIENSTEEVYNENPDYELKVTVAGMPKACHQYVTFSNFKIGATYKGKKQPKVVKGGTILADIDFTIKK